MKHNVLSIAVMLVLMASPLAAQTPPAEDATVAAPVALTTDENAPAADNAKAPSGLPEINDIMPPEEKKELFSLLFAPDEVAAMQSARNAYESMIAGRESDGNESEEDFLKKLESLSKAKIIDKGETLYTYPQFFLSTIVYHSPEDWAIWVNGERIVAQSEKYTATGLKVLAIDSNKVTLQWKPANMKRIVDVGEATETNPVEVDMAARTVNFTLRGNQTFSSYAMKVVEGKVEPITINIDQMPSHTTVKSMAEKPGRKKIPSDESRTGLKGLINGYKNLEQRDENPTEGTTP